jgi:hypothetical protein
MKWLLNTPPIVATLALLSQPATAQTEKEFSRPIQADRIEAAPYGAIGGDTMTGSLAALAIQIARQARPCTPSSAIH